MPSLGLPIYGQSRARGSTRAAGAASTSAAAPREVARRVPGGRRRAARGLLAPRLPAGRSARRPRWPASPPASRRARRWSPTSGRRAGVTPSAAERYATALARGGYARGRVVTSWEGRPTKVEGNREHPASRGGTDAILQASILDLYDPARLAGFTRQGRALGLAALLGELSALAADARPRTAARGSASWSSRPPRPAAELRRRILERFPRARFDAWSRLSDDAARAGAALAFGRPLDAPPRSTTPTWSSRSTPTSSPWTASRSGRRASSPRAAAPRADEPALRRRGRATRVTGGMADHRFRMRSRRGAQVRARGGARALAGGHGLAALAPLGRRPRASGRGPRPRWRPTSPAPGGARSCWPAPASRRRSTPSRRAQRRARQRRAPPWATGPRAPRPGRRPGAARGAGAGDGGRAGGHAGGHRLEPAPHRARPTSTCARSSRKVKETVVARPPRRRDGPRRLLAARGGPPARGLGRPARARRLGLDPAAAHRAAARVDRRAGAPGRLRGRGGSGLLAPGPRGLARARSGELGFDHRWDGWLAAGVAAGTAVPAEAPPVDLARVAEAVRAVPAPARRPRGGLRPRPQGARRPLPRERLAAGAAATRSPSSPGTTPPSSRRDRGRRLGIASGDVLSLSRAGRTVSAPAQIVPGHADDAVTLPLGYGQAVGGAVGKGVGFDAYALRTADAPWFAGGLEVKRTGKTHALATTQEHFSMEGRAIALALDAPELEHARHELDEHRGAEPSILPAVDYSKQEYRWGMAIDLSRCIGCGACTARLPGREQHPGGGQGAGAPQPRDALAPRRPLLRGPGRGSRRRSRSRSPASTASWRPASTCAR